MLMCVFPKQKPFIEMVKNEIQKSVPIRKQFKRKEKKNIFIECDTSCAYFYCQFAWSYAISKNPIEIAMESKCC